MPNCKFYGGRKQATTNLFLSLNLSAGSSRNQLQGNSPTLAIFKFKTDVFAVVAVVDAEAPYFIRMTCTFLLHRQINAEIRAANSKLD